MTGLPRRSDSDTFWSGVAFSVKSGARVLAASIAGCCGSGAGLVAMVPDTSGGTNDTQPSRLKRRVTIARPQPRALWRRGLNLPGSGRLSFVLSQRLDEFRCNHMIGPRILASDELAI